MKRYIISLTFIFVSIIGFSQTTDTLTIQELNRLDLLFSQDELLIENDSLVIPIRKNKYTESYVHNKVYSTCNEDSILKVLLIVDNYVYSSIYKTIIRYAQDIYIGTNQHVVVEKVSNATDLSIKALIKSYNNITGVVLIGNIDFALFEEYYVNSENKTIYSYWPCELFYSDLDGIWEDSDSNGIYDTHTGNKDPEIVVGRIPINNNMEELNLLEGYFNKNHNFWIGNTSINEYKSLDYRNEDWIGEYQFGAIKELYGNEKYDYCQTCENNFGKNDYLNKLNSGEYEFVQIAAHSSPTHHKFNLCDNWYENLTSSQIINNNNKVLGYNLFCCSACNWSMVYSISNLLAGMYIYSGRGLSVVGSTKTGSMLNFQTFYQALSQNESIGNALKLWWFSSPYKSDILYHYFIHWFYGLCIIGDPFISFKYNTNSTCPDVLNIDRYEDVNSNVAYYKAKDKIIVSANFEQAIEKHIIFDAPIVEFSEGFHLPNGTTMEILQDGCECNHITN